jgi:hypothetical protein
MAGPGRALDPDKHFIVVPNHFGGGVSSSGLLRPIHGQTKTTETCLQLLHRSITLLRCGFTPVYALLGRFLPRLKAA